MANKYEDILDELILDWGRERPDIDVSAMAVVGRIIHLGSMLESDANEALKPFKLSYTDFDVLATLRRIGTPYELTPKQLRRSVLITSGAMTACFDRLEKVGLIKRLPDPNDRRGTRVRLTSKGLKLVELAIIPRFDSATRSIASLTKADTSKLVKLLKQLTVSLDNL